MAPALDEVRLAVGLLGLPLVVAIASVYYGQRWVRSARGKLLG